MADPHVCKTRLLTFRKLLRYVKWICISAKNVLSLYQRRGESPQTKGFLLFFHTKMPQKTIVLQSMQKILYAEADFLNAFAEFFRAKLVRELTIQELEKLKDIYFQPCIFFILGNCSGGFLPEKTSLAGIRCAFHKKSKNNILEL